MPLPSGSKIVHDGAWLGHKKEQHPPPNTRQPTYSGTPSVPVAFASVLGCVAFAVCGPLSLFRSLNIIAATLSSRSARYARALIPFPWGIFASALVSAAALSGWLRLLGPPSARVTTAGAGCPSGITGMPLMTLSGLPVLFNSPLVLPVSCWPWSPSSPLRAGWLFLPFAGVLFPVPFPGWPSAAPSPIVCCPSP